MYPGDSLSMSSGDIFFSNAYDNGASCTWTITCPSSSDDVTVTFVAFETEANYDYVSVYDGYGSSALYSPQIFHESGSLSSIPSYDRSVSTTGNVATVEFDSDNSVAGLGFDMEWACGGGGH